MKLKNYIATFVFLVGSAVSFSQPLTSKAYTCYNENDNECARTWIDSAIVSSERDNPQTWQLRGAIYRRLESPENKDYRSIAIESFVQARTLDTEGQYVDKTNELLYKTIIRYYNDAVTSLENNELVASETSYNTYKEKSNNYLKEKQDFRQSDIDYFNALGSHYMGEIDLLGSGEQKEKLSQKAVEVFQNVLALDSLNWQANFNIGIIFYNQGADLAMHADPFTFSGDIEELDRMLTRSSELFKEALPFLHRAERADPSNVGALEGLTGCYYGLNDDDNFNKFQKLLDEHQLPELLQKIEENPNDLVVLKELVRIYSKTIIDEEKYDKYKAVYDKLKTDQ